ncbi:MAG: multicopper oxidase domain-containing protein [Sulfurospirillum sp.]
MKRRNFLVAGALGTAGVAFFGAKSLYSYDVFEEERKFIVPPLYEGEIKDGKRVFNLNLQKGEMEFFKGLKTETIGINAPFLGPTLRAKKDEFIKVNIKNSLGYDSTIHWHGFELPAKMDGGPHQIIKNEAIWSPEFVIKNRASMLWYHSHLLHQTGAQVYKGLAGLFIIDEDESTSVNLPSEYGVDDIPIVLQDRNFNNDGSFRYVSSMPEKMMGIHGNYVLVNGVIAPTLKAKKRLIRFRILNGSNARYYLLGFSDHRKFKLVGSDGGLLEKPVSLNQIKLAPAQRVDIVVDMSDGKDVALKSYKGALKQSRGMMGMMMGGMGFDMEFDLLKVESKGAKSSSAEVPSDLAKHPVWDPKIAVGVRNITLQMRMGMGMMSGDGGDDNFFINGKSMDMNRIDAIAKKDTFEIWKVMNKSPMSHPLHIHNTQFKILSINGRQPYPGEAGFVDTVNVDPMGIAYIMVPFRYYSDSKVPYMFHCHILEHEDGGMMGQLLVV